MADNVVIDTSGLVLSLDAYLKGEATRAIERGAYENVNSFISRQIKVAANIAKNITDRKYPTARSRDPRRHPDPDLPHLADSWDYELNSVRGGAKLINRHPKANMLILGISNPSVIAPTNYVNSKGQVVLVFPAPGQPQHLWSSRPWQLKKPVTRPVPPSQRVVSVNESIPYRAIRQAFRQGRRA